MATAGGFSDAAKTQFGEQPLDELIHRCEAIIAAEHRLHAWCAWRKVSGEALVLGLGALVAGMEERLGHRWQSSPRFRDRLQPLVAQRRGGRGTGHPRLRLAEHEKRIGDFRALDELFTGLTRDWIRARLCAEMPNQDGVTRNSEWGILSHEMHKKKRHLPLRELMASIPTALTKLTPCLLMSPLSIAQYLAADATAFTWWCSTKPRRFRCGMRSAPSPGASR